MGYQDRDYYREAPPEAGVQSMVVRLIIINAAIFLIDLFFGGPQEHRVSKALMLHGDAIVHPWKWYQFFTAGFVHDWSNLWHIAGNMLGLYVFGRRLEDRFGGKEFLRFYLIAIVTGFVVWGVRTYAMYGADANLVTCRGASGAVTAVAILFCLLYPHATLLLFFAIPTPAWLVGLLLVAMDLFGVSPPGSNGRVAFDVHLTGALFALAYWHFGWNFGRLPGASTLRRLWRAPQKWFRPRPQLRKFDPDPSYEDLDAEGDRLLEKVGREGQASLTARERRVLEDYSRRMRQKRR